MVDHGVLGDQLQGLLAIVAGKRIQRVVQHVAGVVGDAAHHFIVVDGDRAARVQRFGGAGDLGRFVADALQVGNDLDGRHDGAQVVGGRLAAHDQVAAGVVQRDFQLVDGVVFAHHAVGAFRIADAEAGHGVEELGLDDAAHQQHLAADGFQFVVILFG